MGEIIFYTVVGYLFIGVLFYTIDFIGLRLFLNKANSAVELNDKEKHVLNLYNNLIEEKGMTQFVIGHAFMCTLAWPLIIKGKIKKSFN